MQDTLDVLKSGEIDDIIEKTSDDSEFAQEVEENEEIANEFDGPGNSENATGQNNEGDLPPGFGASEDNPSESGFENGNRLEVGNIPPGLAKKMFGVEVFCQQKIKFFK